MTSNTSQYIKREFDELYERWRRNKIFTSSQQNVRNYDLENITKSLYFRSDKDFRFLVPFSERMETEKFRFYVAESEFPGLSAEFKRLIVNGLTRKEPLIKSDFGKERDTEIREWILSDFGEDGMPFLAFAARAIEDNLLSDHAWVYVEVPEEPGKIPKAKYVYSENVVNWKVGENNQLVLLVTRGYEEEEGSDEFNPTMVALYTIHRLIDGVYYYDIFYENGTRKEDTEQMSAMYLGKPLDFIPAWPLGGEIEPGTPLLQPVIDKDISLYNKLSRRNHLLYGSTSFTPIIYTDRTTEDVKRELNEGLGRWLLLAQGDKADYLSIPIDGLNYLQTSIKDNMEEMGRMGIRMLAPESNQSGIALQLRNASQVAKLGAVQTIISNTFSSIIRFMISIRYNMEVKFGQFDIGLSDDFQLQSLSRDWLEFFTGIYERALVPRSEWIRLLQQNGLLSDNYDDNRGKEEINGDEMISGGLMTPRGTRDVLDIGQQDEPD